MLTDRITIDFETRSELDITNGPWIYSRHPSTDILCLAYHIPGQNIKLWKRIDKKPPQDLFDAIFDDEKNYYIEAHNVFFELCIWENVGVKKYNWPALPTNRLICSAAKAAAHALPRSLDAAGQAMNLEITKDKTGTMLINKLSKPQKPTKKDSRVWLNEGDDDDTDKLFEQLYKYCKRDVETEALLSSKLDDLTPNERKIWLLDQKINYRGLYVDIDLVDSAIYLLNKLDTKIKNEIVDITNGFVDAPTKRDDILFWLWTEDCNLINLTADTVEKALKIKTLPKKVKRLLELRQLGGKTSVKKFIKFKEWADKDDHRCRGTLMYHGASTGRWSGKGIQPQNLPKGSFNSVEEIEKCINIIKQRNINEFIEKYKNPSDALSSVIRSIITATPGYDMYCADYSAIEARVIVWLAKDEAALKLFYKGKDIYIDMALTIFGLTQQQYNAKSDDKKKFMRGVGKDAILGLGYGMGWRRYQTEAFRKGGQKLDDIFCQTVIDKYRQKYNKIVRLWDGYERAAIHATLHNRPRSKPCYIGRVSWFIENDFLCAQLPSGRCLYYHKPKVEYQEFYGRQKKTLTYWGVHSKTRKYCKLSTYGGHLVENVCQAVARDIMSYAALRAEKAGYNILTSIHDELVAEAKENSGKSLKEFETILSEPAKWSKGCPINCEGWVSKRYRK